MSLEKGRLYQNVVMKLSVLRFMVRSMSKRGKTDINRECEPFFAEVLNYVYGYDLKNANFDKLNTAAIDLVDKSRGLCVQVTSTTDSGKIKNTIKTFIKNKLFEKYTELRFLILGEKKNYTTTFDTQGHFDFDHEEHVMDIDDLLDKAESLGLDKMKQLSDFVDRELPSVSRALEPDSILAGAERNDGNPPATAIRVLSETAANPTDADAVKDYKSLIKLHGALTSLSRKQREVILYMLKNATERHFERLTMSEMTLRQKLGFTKDQMFEYYAALEAAGIMDVDNENYSHPQFTLSWRLSGSHSDAFEFFKDNLNEKEVERVVVDCDFTVLD